MNELYVNWECDLCDEKIKTPHRQLPVGWHSLKVICNRVSWGDHVFDLCEKCAVDGATERKSVKTIMRKLFGSDKRGSE